MRLVPYIRVSSRTQVDEGMGLQVQADLLGKWAESNGHVLVAPPFADEGVSGTKDAAEREGLTAALSAVQTGDADGLVCVALDRIGRVLHVQEAVLATVWNVGGRVFTVDQGEIRQDDPDDPYRTFIRQVMGSAAQLERSLVVLRLKRARALKAAQGGKAVGAYPFGYSVEGPVNREQNVLTTIRELRSEGKDWASVAKELNERGTDYRPRKAAQWSATSANRVATKAGIR